MRLPISPWNILEMCPYHGRVMAISDQLITIDDKSLDINRYGICFGNKEAFKNYVTNVIKQGIVVTYKDRVITLKESSK